ncbi:MULTISPECIES: imidazolonepropionase [Meiothermus]|uniref:Imidazolonepropionase n=2 Tax=Meiothermus hypogaeus TaxID=884155 RepID=A0A511R0X0_9DEIN|nr:MULTISPECIES: imidazolonepropionase [Meiothermus]RIH77887.1 Imidazolonepropionase [Meiothermus hypogaeus]GEM82636.1 imidazolonepropionase [Meiothermus hypogaeus NBRC 106114]GIW35855.1 MAG: imidazolonepropionase [Meiothermus sp.]
MKQVFTGIAELYTPRERLERAAFAVRDGRFVWVGAEKDLPEEYRTWPRADLGGRGAVPGLVDAHSHLVYGGNRLGEYLKRARGESYEAILAAGGGIYATVRATHAASEDELYEWAKARAALFLAQGVTAIEIKSGYGLLPEAELKMLRVIRRLQETLPQHVFPTLLAHVVPQGWERKKYVAMFTGELIPEVARSGLAEAVDVFCDEGAFTLKETRRILEAALLHNLKIKLHAEQIAHTGATKLAAELGALSADHLEQTTSADWEALAQSGTVGTVLPGAAVILRKPFPNARAMWDAGVRVAIATDHNPGSSPLFSPWLGMQLTVSLGRLSLEEALMAHTENAALALGRADLGKIEPGAWADFVVVDSPHALKPLYHWGNQLIYAVYVSGNKALPPSGA